MRPFYQIGSEPAIHEESVIRTLFVRPPRLPCAVDSFFERRQIGKDAFQRWRLAEEHDRHGLVIPTQRPQAPIRRRQGERTRNGQIMPSPRSVIEPPLVGDHATKEVHVLQGGVARR